MAFLILFLNSIILWQHTSYLIYRTWIHHVNDNFREKSIITQFCQKVIFETSFCPCYKTKMNVCKKDSTPGFFLLFGMIFWYVSCQRWVILILIFFSIFLHCYLLKKKCICGRNLSPITVALKLDKYYNITKIF